MNEKVLTVAYTYPPLGGAGAVRIAKFVQYLPRFGWEMVVLAPEGAPSGASWKGDAPSAEVIYTKYFDMFSPIRKRAGSLAVPRERLGIEGKRSLKKWLAWVSNEFVAIPDSRLGWYPYAVREGVKRIQQGDISAIYSSSPPETTHLIAKAIHERTGIPWVAELRDLWTQNPYYQRSFLRLFIECRLEHRTLNDADALVTTTKGFCVKLQDILEGVPVYLVRNGFDPEDFASIPTGQFSKFTIVYTGTLYYPHEDPLPLLRALKDLVQKGEIPEDDIELRFYGTDKGPWSKITEDSSLSHIVSFHSWVSYRENVAIQKGCSAILLLFLGSSPAYGIPVKLYEAMGSGRPIIAFSHEPLGEPVDILRCSNAGEVVSNEQEMEKVLLDLYRAYKHAEEANSSVRTGSQVAQFTRQEAARALAGILDGVSS